MGVDSWVHVVVSIQLMLYVYDEVGVKRVLVGWLVLLDLVD